jgi:predicted amidohydrolase YtcJ
MRYKQTMRAILVVALLLAALGCSGAPPDTVDLVFHDAKVWTGDESRPWAGWIAIRGARIESLGDGDDYPDAFRMIDLGGRLVLPGFNDSHVHFAQAGALLLGVNLLDASDDETFRARILEAAERLPKGSWITGGSWGAHEAWARGSDGKTRGSTSYLPTRELIDADTPDHPVLVTRFDDEVGLANATALAALGLESATGRLRGDALARARERVPAKSFERRVAEARRALEECRRWGVTTVQDMSPLDQLDVYEWLRERGELTTRIHFSPSRLSDYTLMLERGWTVGAGDEWVRFGTLKTHIDGIMGARSARFFEPYEDNPPEQADWRGGWREFSHDLAEFERMLAAADAAGIQLRVHAIGDEANAILLDILDRLEAEGGERDRRFRLVHAQVVRPQDFERFRGRGIVAEVQPYHCTDDMRWMEERIGTERCRGAYAFRSLLDNGCILAFGSDWPGTQASYYPVNPLYGLYAAVTRQTTEGTPPDGWFPEQKIGLEEALRAYTAGGAWATFEDELKGTLAPGRLADLVVLGTDLFEAPPSRWLSATVDFTVAGGEIVYHGAGAGVREGNREP